MLRALLAVGQQRVQARVREPFDELVSEFFKRKHIDVPLPDQPHDVLGIGTSIAAVERHRADDTVGRGSRTVGSIGRGVRRCLRRVGSSAEQMPIIRGFARNHQNEQHRIQRRTPPAAERRRPDRADDRRHPQMPVKRGAVRHWHMRFHARRHKAQQPPQQQQDGDYRQYHGHSRSLHSRLYSPPDL